MIFCESLETHRQTFLQSLKVRSFSVATMQTHSQSLSTFFRYLCGHCIDDLRMVSREDIRNYQLWLGRQNYSTWTICTKLESLRRFFEHLEKTDALLVNPCDGMLILKAGERLPRNVFTKTEVRKILDMPDTQTGKGIRDKAILELFYSTGIRLGEMSQLTLHDVDYKNGFVRINKGKGGKDRVVPMGNKASDYVREYLQKVRSQWVRAARAVDERALWLSSIVPHQPIDKQVISIYVRHYIRAAGIERGSTHSFRHTCATHLVANGANVAYVQRLLGHRSLGTTQIYTRVAIPEILKTHRHKHPRAKAKSVVPKVVTRMKGSYEL